MPFLFEKEFEKLKEYAYRGICQNLEEDLHQADISMPKDLGESKKYLEISRCHLKNAAKNGIKGQMLKLYAGDYLSRIMNHKKHSLKEAYKVNQELDKLKINFPTVSYTDLIKENRSCR